MRALEDDAPSGSRPSEACVERSPEALFGAARLALSELTNGAVSVLEGRGDRADLRGLIERVRSTVHEYHAALLAQCLPSLLASGRAGRALASHVEHLTQLQSAALHKLSLQTERLTTELRAVRELVVTSLVLTQDLEAQRHYLGGVPLSGAA